MQPITVTAQGAGNASPWAMFDPWKAGNFSKQCVVSGVANYTLQFTNDDPNAPGGPAPGAVNWFNDPDPNFVAAATTLFGASQFVPVFARVLINSGTGQVTATFVQTSHPRSPFPTPASPTPNWVRALAAPSGALPVIVCDFANGRYWVNGAATPVPPIVADATWGVWNPSTITPGLGVIQNIGGNTQPNNGTITLPVALRAGLTLKATANISGTMWTNGSLISSAQWAFAFRNTAQSINQRGTFQQTRIGGGPNTNLVLFMANTGNVSTIPLQNLATSQNAPSHKGAFNFMPGTTAPPAASLGGQPTVVGTVADTSIQAPFNVGFWTPAAGNQTPSATSYLALLAIYALQPNADLPAIALL